MLKLPFFYTDRLRVNREHLAGLKSSLSLELSGQRTIVVGSAPNPVFPDYVADRYVCVNGSVHSLVRHQQRSPDITLLNGAILTDDRAYATATRDVLKGNALGHVVVQYADLDQTRSFLSAQENKFRSLDGFNIIERRLIIGEILGVNWWGTYNSSLSISLGIFSVLVCLWCGAESVQMVGFSLNDEHEYGNGRILTPRRHVQSDKSVVQRLIELQLPVKTPSDDFLK